MNNTLWYLRSNCFRSFFWRIEDTKKHFKINWPLLIFITHNRLKLEEIIVLMLNIGKKIHNYIECILDILIIMSSKTNVFWCSSHKKNPEKKCMTFKNFDFFTSTWIIFAILSVNRAIIAIISFADKIFSLKHIWYYTAWQVSF